MPLPSVSSPFDYLIRQIREDLDHAAELCTKIKRNRHLGTQHIQLDALESALADGAGFVLREKRNYTDLVGADLDGGDGEMTSFFPFHNDELPADNSLQILPAQSSQDTFARSKR
jgi:hypothetical protein